MFVLCPHCQFLVAVDPVSGQPPAHCPRCDGVIAPPQVAAQIASDEAAARIDADNQADAMEIPKSASEALPLQATSEAAAEPESVDAGETPAAVDDTAIEIRAQDAVAAEPPASPTPEPKPVSASASLAAVPTSVHRHWRLPLAISGLTVLLALQMLLADRTQLAADARWRPVVAVVCAALGCELPPWHEPAAFTLVDRDVRSDPRQPGVLHVSARFRNDARWPQAWPSVLLTLSDVDGRVAGARLLAPREYAATGDTRKSIASGQIAVIAMDVVEPAPDIVAFTFDFR
jgi:hypothetical protein